MKIGALLVLLIGTSLLPMACQSVEEKEEQLARKHCGSCHQFPAPDLLPKSVWLESVLPQMAFRMGLGSTFNSQVPTKDLPYVLPTLPPAMCTLEEWQSINNYFSRVAPDSIAPSQPERTDSLNQFSITEIQPHATYYPALSLLKAKKDSLFVSNRDGWLHTLGYDLRTIDSVNLDGPASSISTNTEGHSLVTLMGIMDPNDQPKGSVIELNGSSSTVILDSLTRPVFTEQADLNGDQQIDLIVGCFGNYTGSLRAYEKSGDTYKQHTLSFLPGARKAVTDDFNKDGRLDLIVLFAQGDEHLSLFLNQGNFQFQEKVLLRFPPVYGSSYFELADFNSDGALDILYTNGDNMDYSRITKSYHGLRIFLNDGQNGFKESWFYAMPGCSQAVARDFDLDGDLDLAAISYFPDFSSHQPTNFIYLENANATWRSFSSPSTAVGRWLLMETADLDHDGDEDVLLGALDFPNGVPREVAQQWREHPVSILALKNLHFR